MATPKKKSDKGEPDAGTAGEPGATAKVRNLAGEVVSGPPNSIPGEPANSGHLLEEGDGGGEMVTMALAPHLDDLVARPHIVHLTPRVRPGRNVVTLSQRGTGGIGRAIFRRGEDGDLEHVINLTPPQARQLRGEGWIALPKE